MWRNSRKMLGLSIHALEVRDRNVTERVCHRDQVSISPTFYEQLFRTKVFWAAFLYLRLRFVFFGARILAQKLLVKCWWNWPKAVVDFRLPVCLTLSYTNPEPPSRMSGLVTRFIPDWYQSLCDSITDVSVMGIKKYLLTVSHVKMLWQYWPYWHPT